MGDSDLIFSVFRQTQVLYELCQIFRNFQIPGCPCVFVFQMPLTEDVLPKKENNDSHQQHKPKSSITVAHTLMFLKYRLFYQPF